MQEWNSEDLYNPIDLNDIFNDDDILNEWIRKGEEPILSSNNLDWLDKGLPSNEESRETTHEDDDAQVVELVDVQAILHKKEILILIIKVRLLKQFLQVLIVIYPYRLSHYWWKLVAIGILNKDTMISHGLRHCVLLVDLKEMLSWNLWS